MAPHRDFSRTKLAATIHHRPKAASTINKILLACLLLFHHAPGVVDAVLSYPCPHTPNPQFLQDAMPKLPSVFEVHVEANIVKKQLTSEAVEVYDYPNKRAALSITTHNQTVTSIFNYATGERFDITPTGECKTVNLSEASFDVFGFTSPTPSGRPSIMPAADVFRFGDSFPKVFLGEDTVRGIPVYHWQSCQTMKTGSNNNDDDVKAAYVIDYFFTKLGYSTASSSSLIPVRAFINGTALNVDSSGKPIGGTHNFSHVYDFSFFRPGPVEDDSLFEIPRGVVCERRSPAGSKPLPKLPDRFALSMEVYVAGTHRPPMTERMLFDFDFGLIQTDRFAPRGTGAKFSLTQLTIVEDYTNRVQYVVDSYDGNCTVKPLPQGLGTSADGGKGKRDITMRHGQQLLQYGDRDFKYQGQRWVRDMRVDVWADRTESGMIQEIYFLADWPSQNIMTRLARLNVQLDWSRMNILVGTYLRNTTALEADLGPFFRLFGDRAIKPWGDRWQRPRLGGAPTTSSSMPRPGDLLRQHMMQQQQQRSRSRFRWDRMRLPYASEKMIHIFNYLPMHMDMSSFDVSPCYEKDADEMYVYFSLDGTYASVVTSQRYLFMSATKAAVAKAAGISVLRVVKVNVWQDIATSRLNIFFAMLSPPAVAGTGGVPRQPSCQEAYDKLSRAVADGLVITIKHPVKQARLEVVHNSLKKWESLEHLLSKSDGDQSMAAGQMAMSGDKTDNNGGGGGDDGSSDSNSSEEGSKGYTAGQFGGMAFAMLLVGMLLGVVGVYVALRRLRPDIHLLPYQQSK